MNDYRNYKENRYKQQRHDKQWTDFSGELTKTDGLVQKFKDYSGTESLHRSQLEKKLGISIGQLARSIIADKTNNSSIYSPSRGSESHSRIELSLSNINLLPHVDDVFELKAASPPPSKPNLRPPPAEVMLSRDKYPDYWFEDLSRDKNEGLMNKLIPKNYRKEPHEKSMYIKAVEERNLLLNQYENLLASINEIEQMHEQKEMRVNAEIERILSLGSSSNPQEIISLTEITLHQNNRYQFLIEGFECWCDAKKHFLAVEFKVCETDKIAVFDGSFKNGNRKFLSEQKNNLAIVDLMKSFQITMLAALAKLAVKFDIQTVGINVRQTWFDKATGKQYNEIISSLQGNVSQVLEIDLTKVFAKDCFGYLKGILTPQIQSPAVIRPIFEINKEDKRIIPTKNIIAETTPTTNLAMMDWDDFEHLTAQVFELEFAGDGTEIKVTQSSRDKGVDAILFDPNPFKGGKYILQAKRYTNVVGVSAVRDLYGTIVNEGANRGILITTASFGPDAYEFAKDKPISLVDGANLLQLLKKHQLHFTIDIEEAKNALK